MIDGTMTAQESQLIDEAWALLDALWARKATFAEDRFWSLVLRADRRYLRRLFHGCGTKEA